jgi:uncharacterized membrane protein
MINNTKRFWEIDSLRGLMITLMIIFHILYDLNYFNIYKTELYSGAFLILAYVVGSTFLLLVGISLTLSYNKASKNLTKKQLHLKFLKRGLKIFGLGLIITIATWLYLREGFIVFGILHCIGISIILAYTLIQRRYTNLILGIILILLGVLLRTLTFDFQWLVWLGFKPTSFYTVDYYPLLPWLGVVLIGISIGNTIYPKYRRKFQIRDFSELIIIRFFTYLGRNSLIIYFLHQPILITIIHLFLL